MIEFDSLVLSGGGIKGILQLGALHYLSESGILDLKKIKTFAGTSVGSVISLLLCCGFTPLDIFKEIYKRNFFFNIKENVENIFFNLTSKFGFVSIASFLSVVEEMVRNSFPEKKIPTLKELEILSNKTLIISVSNITEMKVEYFSYLTKPDLSCMEAVKISCNIPILCYPITLGESKYVDGGLADNFPIHIIEGGNVLGILVSADLKDDNTSTGYFWRLIALPSRVLTQLRCDNYQNKNCHIIKIVSEFSGDDPVDSYKMDMFLKGYNSAKDYFSEISSPQQVPI